MSNLRKILYNSELIIICTLIWCILKEDIGLVSIIYGFFVSVFSILMSRVYLTKKEYEVDYSLRPIKIVFYYIVLIFYIFKASIKMIPDIILNRHNTIIVDIDTTLEKGMYSVIFANSITLTPGTVVIDKHKKELKVIFLNTEGIDKRHKKFEYCIRCNYEKLLKSRIFK